MVTKVRSLRVIVLAGLLVATTALAQWAWRDQNGQMVFSDQPPPASVKAEQIVRQPGPPTSATAQPPATDSKASPAPVTAKPIAGSKEADQPTSRDGSSPDTAAATIKEQRAQDCERMRRYLLALESGQRVALPDAQGNPVVMDDAARATEITAMRKRLAGC